MQMNDQNKQHPEDNRNLIIFIIIALLLWFGYDSYVLKPRIEALQAAQQQQLEQAQQDGVPGIDDTEDLTVAKRPREVVLADTKRITIDNGAVMGSLSLKGGRIDDLRLQRYYKTLEKKDHVVVLSPAGADHARYAELGWIPAKTSIRVPDNQTIWRAMSGHDVLAKDQPVTLYWEGPQGVRFEKTFTIDENYMITVTQRVINNGKQSVSLYPYSLVMQHGMAEDYQGGHLVHEGPTAYLDGELLEHSYKKTLKEPEHVVQASSGWIGLSEKYWFTGLVPAQDGLKKFRFLSVPAQSEQGTEKYQTDIVGSGVTIDPGSHTEVKTHLFAGAKEITLLEEYEETLSIRHFDLAVDFGLYYFMTKPFFHILNFLGGLTGHFGIAIICLTILIRAAVFPLANTSYKSFAKLKKVSPQMKELREKYGDDREKLQAELVKLYEREKVNPAAGCFPILIQIPIFFALYKTLNVTIEMRHAPFFGWIQDLSEPDPTTIFNLFGLLPFNTPDIIPMIGAWPCIMLVAMLIQRRLNPPPQDPTQAMMMNVMPFLFTFILSRFAAGLVIYWTFSNIFSVIQQYIIMRSMGVEVHLFKRTRADKEMEEMVKDGPAVHPELEMVEDEVEDALFGDDDQPVKPISKPKPKKKSKSKRKKKG